VSGAVRSARTAPVGAERLGYAIAVLVDVAGLVVLHLWPGWEQVPVLTEDTPSVLGIVDVTLVIGIVVGLVQVARGPGRTATAGSMVTTAVGIVAMVRVVHVFPFDLSDGWTVLVRALLVFGIAGAAVGLLASAVSLVRDRRSPSS